LPEWFRRCGVQLSKILQGGRASDLPVERPHKFEFVLDLKTARTLGLTIPQSLLIPARGRDDSVMVRRVFIGSIASAFLVMPLAAWAQTSATPTIGYLGSLSPGTSNPQVLPGFRAGLAETGYIEGKNVVVEYRWAEGHYDRLPTLAADLVSRHVAVLVAGTAALVAKATTSTIPIVFVEQSDPVGIGLVASLNRPGGNLTGVTTFAVELDAKRLELLHELVPKVSVIALLLNPDRATSQPQAREAQVVARSFGLQLQVLSARTEQEIDERFAKFVQLRPGALLVGSDPFFDSRREQIIGLAARHAVPTIFELREFVAAGGLMSYGPSLFEAVRQVGIYTGRILHGAKPADLPVLQPTKFELVINLKTAKALGLTIPPSLLQRADQVIE
jgi:putative ABC transport system substrate-binding protein